MIIGNGQFLQGDCLELMREIPDGSVDMVLCDLPYGTTKNKWDSIIPFEPLWEQYWRVCKPNAAVVLTAAQPFTSSLVMSQVRYFKYSWTWCKSRFTGNLNAKKQPLRGHEDVLVFYKSQPSYEAYTDKDNPLAGTKTPISRSDNYGRTGQRDDYTRPDKLTKVSILKGFDTGVERGIHPTQKPVALFEYLIRTYTNEGEHVLDNTAGSGTTAIAAENAGRRWTCIERDQTYYEAAVRRVSAHVSRPLLFRGHSKP